MNSMVSRLSALTIAFVLILATTTAAQPGCEAVKGVGTTLATGPFTFQGSAVFSIAGQEYDVTVTTSLLGPPRETEDGTLHGQTSHIYAFDDGSSIITLDNAVLSPTATPGLYDLSSRLEIIGGTGIYENACGKFAGGGGSIDLINGAANWRTTGRICQCG